MFNAVVGPYTTSENALSVELLERLAAGMMCLADRGFYSFAAWQRAAATGADLLWRVKGNLNLDVIEGLPDGSWPAHVYDSVADRRREHPVLVRVIEYTVADGLRPALGDRVRLR